MLSLSEIVPDTFFHGIDKEACDPPIFETNAFDEKVHSDPCSCNSFTWTLQPPLKIYYTLTLEIYFGDGVG